MILPRALPVMCILGYNPQLWNTFLENSMELEEKIVEGIKMGRPVGSLSKNTIEKQAIRDKIRNFVGENIGEIMEAMMLKAKGDKYVFPDGSVRFLDPDPAAAKLLIEHAIGKPAQRVEVEDEDGKAISFHIVSYGHHDTPSIRTDAASHPRLELAGSVQDAGMASQSSQDNASDQSIAPSSSDGSGDVLVCSPVPQPSEEDRMGGSGDASALLSSEDLGEEKQ